ncbi:hypothetical protein EJV47_06760 [Hymenobacter gummosus]|uniref:Uncharacterized protein n=1 Tax=Hymenobacter gummosus TaxID=1776032 RepID=A0A431U5N2_9BACT|nr:hypothetical protein [Hymenobacter gummosus]RTQ51496.1 hypothetical protein EJV47_06760 [Hymenobacter gummosus]
MKPTTAFLLSAAIGWLLLAGGCAPAPKPPVPAEPASYAAVLRRAGLVAPLPRHRRWLHFCDTTRDARFRLGRQLPQVWAWLADYYERVEAGNVPEPAELVRLSRPTPPDSLPPPSPPPPPPTVRFHSPSAAAEQQRQRQERQQRLQQRQQTARLLTAMQRAGLLPGPWRAQATQLQLLACAADRSELLYLLAQLATVADTLRRDTLLLPALQRAGLLRPEPARRLRRALARQHIIDPIEVLPYLRSPSCTFSRAEYPAAPGAYLRQLHQDVAGLLGLTLTDFRYQMRIPPDVLPCAPYCPDNRELTVSFRVDGRRYAYRSDWVPVGSEIDHDDFCQLFNRILAERDSAYRLVSVGSSISQNVGCSPDRFGLWLLTAAQARRLEAADGRLRQLRAGYDSVVFQMLPPGL